jgi:hypothetical protein
MGATGPAYANLNINNQTGATYTLAVSDAGKLITMNYATANILNIDTHANVALPVGTVINVARLGTGQTTIVGLTGVTVVSTGTISSAPVLAEQYAEAICTQIATNVWLFSGNIG